MIATDGKIKLLCGDEIEKVHKRVVEFINQTKTK